jgi:hypothetical protein
MLSKLLSCFVTSILLFGVPNVLAGEPEPPVPPGTGTMKSLQEIYDKLDSVQSEVLGACAGQCDTDAFIPKTGQTGALWVGDDGHLEKGVAWPDPRFTDNQDGTTTDNLTGLVWMRHNFCHHDVTWKEAVELANNLAHGQCNLTDGSSAGDWRLPNIRELESLVDYGHYAPALPLEWDDYFIYWGAYWWSSTTAVANPIYSWVLDLSHGHIRWNKKTRDCYTDSAEDINCYGITGFWAVRDPQQP